MWGLVEVMRSAEIFKISEGVPGKQKVGNHWSKELETVQIIHKNINLSKHTGGQSKLMHVKTCSDLFSFGYPIMHLFTSTDFCGLCFTELQQPNKFFYISSVKWRTKSLYNTFKQCFNWRRTRERDWQSNSDFLTFPKGKIKVMLSAAKGYRVNITIAGLCSRTVGSIRKQEKQTLTLGLWQQK